MSTKTRKVQKQLMQFTAPVQFGAVDSEKPTSVPISMFVRDAGPINHWYWGEIVHDFEGMSHKARIPMDWAHGEELGYLDRFEVKPEGLYAYGEIVPFRDDDKASEVIHRGKAGVPYEASIDWSGNGTRLEEIPKGETTSVNGRELEGPLTVCREWPLKAAAICKFGADSNTQTVFSNSEETVLVTLFSEDENMSDTQELKTIPETTPETAAAVTETATETPPVVPDTAEAQRYIETFGDRGARWFIEGVTFEEGLQRVNRELQAELEESRNKASAAEAAVGATEITEHTDSEDQKPKGFEQFIRIPKR